MALAAQRQPCQRAGQKDALVGVRRGSAAERDRRVGGRAIVEEVWGARGRVEAMVGFQESGLAG